MNAYTPIRTASDPQPAVADSILRCAKRLSSADRMKLVEAIVESLPIREQVVLVQAIIDSPAWQLLGYEDGQRIDRSLANFTADLECWHAADGDTLNPYREAASDRAYYQAVVS